MIELCQVFGTTHCDQISSHAICDTLEIRFTPECSTQAYLNLQHPMTPANASPKRKPNRFPSQDVTENSSCQYPLNQSKRSLETRQQPHFFPFFFPPPCCCAGPPASTNTASSSLFAFFVVVVDAAGGATAAAASSASPSSSFINWLWIPARLFAHHVLSASRSACISPIRAFRRIFWLISLADWKMTWPQLGVNALACLESSQLNFFSVFASRGFREDQDIPHSRHP
jgi:hypothetical protein